MTFATLVLIEFFKAYSYRSDRHSVWTGRSPTGGSISRSLWELVMLVLVVNVPFLQDAFGTRSLSGRDWVSVAGSAFTIVPVLEVAKRIAGRRWIEERRPA